MATIYNTTTDTVRKANAALANAMFSRAYKLKYSKVCGTTRSTSQVEPFTLNGSAPVPQRWNGFVNQRDIKSWSLNVPNSLFKGVETIERQSIEFDQTRTLLNRLPFHGARLAQVPDFLLAKRMIQGGVANSHKLTFGNTTYTTTFDATEIYSSTHPAPAASNQSNIVQGYLPQHASSVFAQDTATTVQQIINSIGALNNQISTTVDDHGVTFFPEYDPSENLVIFAPPCLAQAGKLLMTPGVLAGTGGTGGGSGSTTNIGPSLIKEWVTWPFLAGVPDVENDVTTTISPTYQTQFYACIVGDIVQPWYFQRFESPRASDVIGGDPSEEARRMAQAAVDAGMPPNLALDMAALFTYSEIDHNFNALGSNAQWESAVMEKFFIAPRAYAQVFPGIWPLNWLINPSGNS